MLRQDYTLVQTLKILFDLSKPGGQPARSEPRRIGSLAQFDEGPIQGDNKGLAGGPLATLHLYE